MRTEESRVYLVDDDEAVLRSLARLIKTVGYSVETFSSATDFLAVKLPQKTSCLISDIRMQGFSGLDLQKELLKRKESIPVIFLTGHATIAMSVEAVKNGALDFIEKQPFDEQKFFDVIGKALKISEANLMKEKDFEETLDLYKSLTTREVEVFDMVAEGNLNKEIANVLSIGERTVKMHRARVMEKLQAESVVELARLADQLKSNT
jgi:FixJ family two-component response regulator